MKKLYNKFGNILDQFNSIPDNATEFGFYLKVKDTKAFYDALLKLVETEHQKDIECASVLLKEAEARHQAKIKELREFIKLRKEMTDNVECDILLAKLNEIGGKDDN